MRTGRSGGGNSIQMEITIKSPANFNFRRTLLSHGWCVLLPFEFDKTNWTLIRVLDGNQSAPVTVKISSIEAGLKVSTSRRLGKKAAERVMRDVRHMFRLDDDIQEFYGTVSAHPEFAWIADEGAGRLLRSP